MPVLLLLLCFSAWSQIPDLSGTPVDFLRMRILDVAPGDGAEAKPGQKYTVHYTGWLTDGKKFDSSRDRNEPFTFVQGRRQVIGGWDSGFEGMKVGGKRRLFIPYQMAYGEKGSGSIPPKSELVFDVELLKVEDVPVLPAGQDVLVLLTAYEKKVVLLAEKFPAEKWDWRPAPGLRSFGEVVLHIAYTNKLLMGAANKIPTPDELRPMQEAQSKKEKEAMPKVEALPLLKESFAAAKKQLEPLRAGALGREIDFFGMSTTVRGVYMMLDGHVAEHLGQLIAYARMNGIAPPWSE